MRAHGHVFKYGGAYIEMLKSTGKQYEESTGKISGPAEVM